MHQDAEEKMAKSIEVMSTEFRGIRSGRATPALVDNIKVEYYGSPTPLKQLAAISVPEARLIVIKPYDPTLLGAIEKSIQKSDIGINPANDGKLIRLSIPPLSEERRKQLSKMVKDISEKAKVSVRNIRRDILKVVEDEEKKKTLTEDDKFKLKDDVQKLTEKYEKQVEEHLGKKTKEIMEV
ncbi:MAG: ribosome recycling factor [Planctomycetes bacterium]|nr:ribosome recycling factor [Planctomycetota bacterium]